MIASQLASNSPVNTPSRTANPVTSVALMPVVSRPWLGNQPSSTEKIPRSSMARKKTGMQMPSSDPETEATSSQPPRRLAAR